MLKENHVFKLIYSFLKKFNSIFVFWFLILAGCMQTKLPLNISGIVVEGKHEARQLGYPTANIFLGNCKLKKGVYICSARLGANEYPAMCYTGFPNHNILEIHIFQFDKNIYGNKIDVRLYKHLRNPIKFVSLEQLQTQIRKDAKMCFK